ncbi:MAG: sigma-54-dependent Fis family transcriptional regulator [Ignavibacteriales bacterium]|nr:sigma-54-dependent Fis family transcriptional regulator [Ignavibacteriales bacterium]MBI3787803.1 sigma-54-dependent Fis family transcriptional regulator [Ignavibacteriales bacterium]
MTMKYRILVVDDEESITFLLKTELEELPDYDVDVALNGTEAINLIQSKIYDVVLLDIKMPRVSGIDVLKYLNEHSPSTQVIMLTNVVDMKTAIETIKLGAYDFVSKPYDPEQLQATVSRAIEKRKLVIEKEVMKNELNRIGGPVGLIGESDTFKHVIANAKKVAASEAFILIQGASGTGKELVAQLIHNESSRKEQPFVAVNCASIPDQLLESELFGHEKGSFTNAYATKQGLVEVANGGTLFLDEVGDISQPTQAKLLRFLETGEFRRVGGTASMKVDVRVVSATNKNLPQEVQAGRFREDLLYRLNVVSIQLPLLRERREDIPLLVDYFLARQPKSKAKKISPEAMVMLMKHDWPGNVRELEHVIEGGTILCQGEVVEPHDLWMNPALSSQSKGSLENNGQNDLLSLEELEKIHIERVLKFNQWNRVKTAQMLGITPKTLYLKIKRYRIKVGSSIESE